MTEHDGPMRRIQVSEPRPPCGIQVSDANGPLFTVDTYDQLRTLGLTLEAIANRRQALTADQADQKRRTFERAWHGLPSASDYRDRARDIGCPNGPATDLHTRHDHHGQGIAGV